MSLQRHGQSSSGSSKPVGITEFEILKASHKFLREGDENASSWDEKLAAKYYASLYREFAVCDLKHYKSGNFALRWRTEEEVLSGAGEETCGNTRCELHFASHLRNVQPKPVLTTLELPFVYVEHGETKSALVKVVLCGKCLKKLMWKRQKEKGIEADGIPEHEVETRMSKVEGQEGSGSRTHGRDEKDREDKRERHRRRKRSRDRETEEEERSSRRRRSSQPRSPRRSSKEDPHPGSSS
ncbi:hypothetical protein NLJ89_g8089 [Agrocybe chaxingu]|uniref:Protein FRA10AC1 n=1 Tax=Agrocybe chaxingu TaxID=84603 RepID=A0A9W8JV38_9AGAR|nr:hypothetical protein NLJ89_g8089 [Agrocybe chaxingu]